mmetsp:Transcript_48956/g.158192  ORF Transcript_48956/g.158192 Transcript_48956/m.158192 type:complete len:95 (+) Transcript_48956:108-392(+)
MRAPHHSRGFGRPCFEDQALASSVTTFGRRSCGGSSAFLAPLAACGAATARRFAGGSAGPPGVEIGNAAGICDFECLDPGPAAAASEDGRGTAL